MEGLQIFCLLLYIAFVLTAPNGYIDDDEQRFIDYLSKHGSHRDEERRDMQPDELERERMAIERQQDVQDEISKNDQKYHLMRKSAVAVVQRLSMPSPPGLDVLIDKAVHYVMKKTMVREYEQIRTAIQELVDKMLHRNRGNEGQEARTTNSPTSTGLREERIVLAMEEIIQELAIRLNLTTSQTKKIVDISVKVLAKHLGLNGFQREELHERVTSQVRKILDIEDEDNRDARLRRLEERIEKDIEKYKLSAQQVKRMEQLMVEEEAIEEGLTKEERARMLKRVYADVVDDLRTQINEEKIKPPNLNDVQLTAVNQLIRQEAIGLQLNHKEIKVLGLAILTAVEHLSRMIELTPGPHGAGITTGIPTTIKSQWPTTMKTTEQKTVQTQSVDELREEEELENKKPTKRVSLHETTAHAQKTSQRTSSTHARTEPKTTKRTTATHAHKIEDKTTPMVLSTHAHETLAETTQKTSTPLAHEAKPTSQRSPVKEKTDLDAILLQDEAELEGKDFADRSRMDEGTKAEELALILDRKIQDKEKAKMKASKSNSVVKTSTDITKPPEVVTKPTESRSTHKVTQVTEMVTEKTKPTNKKTEKVTESVTQKVASVTQSELSKKRLEEELLEEHLPEPSKSHVTQPRNQVVTQPRVHITDITQHNTEHVTTFKPTEDFVKELKNIIESKPIHSRKNHEMLQDELEMEDLGKSKNENQQDTSLEDELKRASNLFKQKTKQKTLDEELNEIFKTKNRKLKKIEDEFEDLSR